MADTKQTIDIIFNGVDRTAGAVSSVIGGVETGANKLKSLAAPIADVTAGVLKFEAAVLASGAALTVFAVKTAGDFDAAFREISTLIDAPLEDLQDFRQGILEYASNSTQSLDQVTASIYGAISAGVDYTDSIATVRQAEQLAVASKADLGDTLVLLVSSLNAYGKGADDAERYSDALITTVKQGQTTLPELAGSLAQVTGLAAGSGVQFETLLSAVAALTAAGMPTSQAITAIKASLSNIIKPSAAAAAEAERLGIQFDASALKTKGFEGVLADVAEATGGNVEIMGRLFGSVEGLNGVISLTGTGAEKFTGTMQAMGESAGATEEAFGKMADAIGLGGQRIENSLKALLVGIGTPLLDEFGGVQEAVAAIFQAIGQSIDSGSMGSFIDQIEALAQDAERFLAEVAKNLPEALGQADFSGFIDGIQVVVQAVKELFGGVDLSTADGLAHAIEVVGSGFLTLQTFVANTITAVGPFLELLADIALALSEMDPQIVATAGSIGGLAIVAGPVLAALTGVAGAIKAVAGGILGASGLAQALMAVSASPALIAAGLTAMGAAAYKTGEFIYGLSGHAQEYDKIQSEIAKSQERFAGLNTEVTQRLAELSSQTGVNIRDMEHFNKLAEEGALVFDDASGKWVKAAQDMEDSAGATAGLIDWSKELEHLSVNLDQSKEAVQDANAAYFEMQGTTPDLARRMAELGGSGGAVEKTTEAMEDAASASETFQAKMEELASNERIKTIEMAVDLRTAELEAGAAKVRAVMDSIGESVGSTGDTISSLFDTLSDTVSTDTRNALKDQIDAENTRRDELMQAQIDAMKAYTEAMETKNKAIQSGEGLIKIQADGLEPALEMILWNVMEKVQLRVNEEAAEFLIGLNGA